MSEPTSLPNKPLLVLEAALLTAQESLSINELKRLFDAPISSRELEQMLATLVEAWSWCKSPAVGASARAQSFRNISTGSPQKKPRATRAP